jgi:glyoxylase-like metal-dependent hydrolase (beta-lactamase superfamily II)
MRAPDNGNRCKSATTNYFDLKKSYRLPLQHWGGSLGVILIPTPGHTDGHHSLDIRKSDGTVVVAGQSHDTATAYSADLLA